MGGVCCCHQSHHGRTLVVLVSVEYRRAFARQRNVHSHRWRTGLCRNGTAHQSRFSHLSNKALPVRQARLGCAAPQSASPATPCVEGLMRHQTAGRLMQNSLTSPKHGSCFWIGSAAIHSLGVSGAHHASCRCPTATADEHIRPFFALSFSLGERTALPVNFRCALLGGRKPQFRSRHMSRMFLVAQPHSAAFLHICRT